MPTSYLQIALPIPLRRLFDYLPPGKQTGPKILQPGIRVEVPFGRQTLVGILVKVSNSTDVPANKLKPVIRVLDDEPLLPASLLNLIEWASSYYQFPFGEGLLSVIPAHLREGRNTNRRSESWWRLTTFGKGLPENGLKRSPKQALLLNLLQQKNHRHHDLVTQNISTAILRTLKEKKLIEKYEQHIEAYSHPTGHNENLLKEPALTLNSEQQLAVKNINDHNGFSVFLLQGITGSGKTEVYLQIIEKKLRQNKRVLVLVPEIGLTPQTIDRFQKRFNTAIVVLHSGFNNTQRLQGWLDAAHHRAAIIIGTRSAIFTPIPDLGLIIIDEEHDQSFKQQDGFRYNARDVGIMRAQREKIPILLGSATPSLETLRNAQTERYRHLRLTQRAGNARPPTLSLLDISKNKLNEGFSEILLAAIESELNKQQQILIFLNRRGYAPVLLCSDCGWIAHCDSCDAKLTVHKQDKQLRCHHCGWHGVLPGHCIQCHSPHLQTLGLGTQRSEEFLKEKFPQIPVLRIDRDSTSRKNSLQNLLDQIHRGEPAILLGTQMLAKGHHFPNVTLVVILDADSGMFSADFRSAERLAQLIIQVAGRAGRAEKSGHVVIQTRYSDHPLMQTLATQDYDTLAQQLLHERELYQLPPYRQQAILRCETTYPDTGQKFLQKIRTLAETDSSHSHPLQITGPLPALMEKRANRFRYELIFSSSHRPALQKMLTKLAITLEQDLDAKKLRWGIDVDPV